MGINEYIEHTIREEGREEGIVASIENLLISKFFKEGIMTYEDIAQLQKVPVERVKAIHANMKN